MEQLSKTGTGERSIKPDISTQCHSSMAAHTVNGYLFISFIHHVFVVKKAATQRHAPHVSFHVC